MNQQQQKQKNRGGQQPPQQQKPQDTQPPKPEAVKPEAPSSNGSGSADTSLLAGLRAKRKAISRDRRLFLDIPGYDGELVAEYKPVPWDQLKDVAEKAERSKSYRKELNSQADTIVLACDEIHLRRNGELDALAELFPEIFGDQPARYDDRLGKFLEFDCESARQAVLRTFNNDLAVTAHQQELGEWLQSSNREDDEDFTGAS